MKKHKRLGILALLLVILIVATVALERYEEKQEQIKNSEAVILEIPTDSVQTLRWEYGETTLSFHRDTVWLYDEDENFPVDEDKIAGLLAQFEAFSTAFIIEAVEDYGQYGLEEPECTITFTTADSSYEVKLGAFSTMDEKRYVDIGDGNVYLVSHDPLEEFDAVLSDLIKHDEVPDFQQVQSVSFAGTENYTIHYDESGTGSYSAYDVYFTADGRVLDTDKVDYYLYLLKALSLTDYVTYNVTDAELESYGLDDPELTITVEHSYEDENEETVTETFVLYVSRDPEALAEAAEATAVSGYVRVGDSQIVYAIDGDTCAEVMSVSYNDLRHRELFWGDFDIVYQMDITLEDSIHTLLAVTDADTVSWYFEADVPEDTEEDTGETQASESLAQPLDMSGLETGLDNLLSSEFTAEAPEGKEEIRLTLYLDNGNFPSVEIALYRYDGTYCLAQVDGKTVSLVSRSSVVDLIEAVQALVLN